MQCYKKREPFAQVPSMASLHSVMSSTQRLVQPKLPTTLANDTHVDLPGQDMWLLYLDNVHVIPTKLDVSKFEDALSRVLQLYPHTVGRLRCTDGCWSIELTDSAVPVDVEYKFGMRTDSILDDNWVIQDDLSLFINQHPVGANFINGDAPLLRLKLTLFDDETCIGFTWNHSLGDGIMISRFMHMLSQFYQGLPFEFASPTFKKYHFPSPSTADKLSAHPTHHFDEVAFIESRKRLESVRWRFDARDLEELRSALISNGENKKYVSRHDSLTAYLIAVLNKARSKPVQSITNVTTYRHISAPFIDENVAGNLILHVPASVPTDMAGIAAAIRDSLLRFREPSGIYLLESLKTEHMIEAANARKLIPYSFDDNELLVNSNVAVDWRSAHFGFPSSTQFYTHGVFKDIVRCFKSNPTKGGDGVWQTRQAIDISVGVSAELKPKILETLARGIQYMLDNQHVQL